MYSGLSIFSPIGRLISSKSLSHSKSLISTSRSSRHLSSKSSHPNTLSKDRRKYSCLKNLHKGHQKDSYLRGLHKDHNTGRIPWENLNNSLKGPLDMSLFGIRSSW